LTWLDTHRRFRRLSRKLQAMTGDLKSRSS
jgi:hypothetical protein